MKLKNPARGLFYFVIYNYYFESNIVICFDDLELIEVHKSAFSIALF